MSENANANAKNGTTSMDLKSTIKHLQALKYYKDMQLMKAECAAVPNPHAYQEPPPSAQLADIANYQRQLWGAYLEYQEELRVRDKLKEDADANGDSNVSLAHWDLDDPLGELVTEDSSSGNDGLWAYDGSYDGVSYRPHSACL
jgi:hypothetical protein